MPTTPPDPDERVYTVLLLLTLALRPLPEGTPPGVKIDRAGLWRIASEAGAPLGRKRFHAAVRRLAEDEDGEGWGYLVFLPHAPHNRQSVGVVQVSDDAEMWEEALDVLGLSLDIATEAARLLGLDTESP